MNQPKRWNGIMIGGVVANSFAVFSVATGGELPIGFALFMGLFVLISMIGLLICFTSSGKTGPILVAVGSVLFVPLGLIAVFGVRKVLDEIQREKLATAECSVTE